MLKSYQKFIDRLNERLEILNESAPRLPNSEDYWKKKGKEGKKVMIYFHDDLDGIYSATVMKNHVESKGFEVVGYGIINYQEGWTGTRLNDKYINIALDYAENIEGIDLYMDHHGSFKEGENKDVAAVKTNTGSAYEGICDQLGIPVDGMILNIIDMVDSAKYDQYDVDIKNILQFDTKKFKNKLEFAAAFNQLLKRSESKTFIEVVANTKDKAPSVYNLFKLFRILYPANNLNNVELKKLATQMGFEKENSRGKMMGDVDALIDHIKKSNPKVLRDFEKDFLDDAFYRMKQKDMRTWGGDQNGPKQYVDSQDKFKELFGGKSKFGKDVVKMPGYQIIGNMCFVPSGTWANALTARSLLERNLLDDNRIPIIDYHITNDSKNYSELKKSDGKILELVGDIGKYEKHQTLNVKMDVTNDDKVEGIKGVISVNDDDVIFKAKQPIFWILLQYGNTMQVASLHNFDLYVKEYLPKLKDGSTVDNLGKYCEDLLYNMAKTFGYNVLSIPSSTTKAGGHVGIGSISNIFGSVDGSGNLMSVPDPNDPKKKIELSEQSQKFMKKFNGTRFLDLIKNKMIDDLSGIDFRDLKMTWGDKDEAPPAKPRDEDMNKKVLMKDKIRNVQDVQKQYSDWDDEDIAQQNAKL
jgi:hypothetical protein